MPRGRPIRPGDWTDAGLARVKVGSGDIGKKWKPAGQVPRIGEFLASRESIDLRSRRAESLIQSRAA